MLNFDEIKEIVGAKEIILAQTVGSVSYGALQPSDEDIVLVVDKKEKRRFVEDGKDYFIFTREEYKTSLSEEYGASLSPLLDMCSLINNEAAKTNHKGMVRYGETEFSGVNLFDNKKKAFQRVMSFGKRNFFNPHVRNSRGDKGCAKLMSWALWYYYAFQNGSLELTNEQQRTLQLCHDGNLPIEYAKQLIRNIDAILEK